MLGNQTPRISTVPPSVSSAGPHALEMCRLAGLTLDPWQENIIEAALGEREDKRWAAAEVVVVVARQNGKSEIALARLLVGAFLLGEREQIFSSHLFDSAMVVFRRLTGVIEDTPSLMRRVKRINRAHGSESVELTSGARIAFRTRTKSGGRGHSCDCLILDEAHILSQQAHDSLMPTLSARRRAQAWLLGTAGDQQANEDSIVLARVRERAIKGGKDAERLAFFEWSADVDSPDEVTADVAADPNVWAACNPALGVRITVEQIEAERAAMDPRGFAVERLSVGDWPRGDGLPGVIDPEAWKACHDPESAALDPVALAFDVRPDRSVTSIAACGIGADYLPCIEVIETRQGTAGVPERLLELTERHRVVAVITDPAGPAASLLPALERLGVKLTLVTATQHAQAAGMFFDYVAQKSLRYRRRQSLDVAVENACKRPLGDAGWAWSRKSSSVDISPLVSVTLALWGRQTILSYDGPLLEII